ncbi:hypothetical protein [Nocardia bovistercoris]|uniref:Uncharacterized protein n=1 Tax=Nocardia bovistercoris TaxID=2785916 RepID=A0A931N7E0_9NOCA|nr:hypothetical protein [Nocardia bovistercoris]MBH0781687.1 hypothetical protein [Nocardia bovistercoris]
MPKVRLVEYLSSNRDTRALTAWLAAVVSDGTDITEDPARRGVAGFLSSTDHPALLEALEARFDHLVTEAIAEKHGGRPHGHPTPPIPDALRRLWTPQGRPTPFTRILLDNPFLPRHLGPRPEAWRYAARGHVLEAIVHNRSDLVRAHRHQHGPAGWVRDLLDGAQLGAPPEITARCEQVLRTLEGGEAREALCDIAVDEFARHTRHAREIVLATGYTWSGEQRSAAFLFLTEQWTRYDELDPDGTKLRAFCERDETLSPRRHRPCCQLIAEIAVRTQRPNPCDEDFWNHYPSRTRRPGDARSGSGFNAGFGGGRAGGSGVCGGGGGGCGGGGGGGG